MTTTTAVPAGAKEIAPNGGIRFTVAARPQRRFSNLQTISNLTANSFAPIPLTATGWMRRVTMMFTVSMTCASAGAVVAGDGPWNLITGITFTDATGQPVYAPVNGYNLRLINKYLPSGLSKGPWTDPIISRDYAYSATATTGTALFRLDLEFEQDEMTGYGCIGNLDANASPQLKIDVAPYSVAFSGTTVSAATIGVRVETEYYSALPDTLRGVSVNQRPPGNGDFLEIRYENDTVTAATENLVPVTARGGLTKGIIAVSRAAGVRTAYTAGSNVGLAYDNVPVDEGIPFESHQARTAQLLGYTGTEFATSYAPITAGTMPGLDRGVIVWPFWAEHGGHNRDSWLSTRVGTLLQLRLTPGASATQLEIITGLMQVDESNASVFYGPDMV